MSCLSTSYTQPVSPLQPTAVALQWVWSTHLQHKIHSWVQTPMAWSLLHGTVTGGVIKGQMSLIPVVLCCWTFVPQMSLISADGQGLKCSCLTTCASVYNTLCEWVSQPHRGCCVNHYMVRTELHLDVTRYQWLRQLDITVFGWLPYKPNINPSLCEYSTPVAGLCEGARDISAAMWSSTWILWPPCGLAHLYIIMSHNVWTSM